MVRDEGNLGVRWTTRACTRLGENQTMELRADPPRRASVNELGGSDVLVPGQPYRYQLDAARNRRQPDDLAGGRRRVAAVRRTHLNPQRLAEGGQFVDRPLDLITLRPSDRDRSPGAGTGLPGVVVTRGRNAPHPVTISPPRWSARSKRRSIDELDGAAGWRVVSINQNGADVGCADRGRADPAPAMSITLTATGGRTPPSTPWAARAQGDAGRDQAVDGRHPLAVARTRPPTPTARPPPPASTRRVDVQDRHRRAAIDRSWRTRNTPWWAVRA